MDAVDLAAPFNELSSTAGLVVLGVLTVADFVGDKIPAGPGLVTLFSFVVPLLAIRLVVGLLAALIFLRRRARRGTRALG